MPTRNVNLTDHLDAFVDSRIHSGRFSNASEVVREGLRLLERQEAEDAARLEALREITREAMASIDRGESIPVHRPEDLDDLVARALQSVLDETSNAA